MLEKLNKQFVSRYSKKFAELNKNVYIAAKNDDGTFDTPVPTLGPGGGTVIKPGELATSLKPAAIVQVINKKMKSSQVIYRIAFPRTEMEIAAEKPEYFNYLMDNIVDKALNNYKLTFGDENKVRFGTIYCTYENPSSTVVFKEVDDEKLELCLYGDWAGNEEAT